MPLVGSDHQDDPERELTNGNDAIQELEYSHIRKDHHEETGDGEKGKCGKNENRLQCMKPHPFVLGFQHEENDTAETPE